MTQVLNKFVIISLFCIISTFCKSSNKYINYYKECQKAEVCYYTKDFHCAIDGYEKALEILGEIYLFDEFHLALSKVKLNDSKYHRESFLHFENILKQGYPFNTLEKLIPSSYKKTKYYTNLVTNKKSYEAHFHANYNIDLVNLLSNLVYADKFIRGKCDQQDSVCSDLWTKTINFNFSTIEQLVDSGIFPGYQEIGYHIMNINLVLLHGKTDSLSFERFNSMKNILYQQVRQGNYPPGNFAYWVDGYHTSILKDKQIYGTVYKLTSKGKELYLHESEDKINQERNKLGLIPIKEYCKVMNIRNDFD